MNLDFCLEKSGGNILPKYSKYFEEFGNNYKIISKSIKQILAETRVVQKYMFSKSIEALNTSLSV